MISLRLTADSREREAELMRLAQLHQRTGSAARAQPAETRSLTRI